AGVARPRGGAGGVLRPAADGRGPAELALPARPAHRRVRRTDAAAHRLIPPGVSRRTPLDRRRTFAIIILSSRPVWARVGGRWQRCDHGTGTARLEGGDDAGLRRPGEDRPGDGPAGGSVSGAAGPRPAARRL